MRKSLSNKAMCVCYGENVGRDSERTEGRKGSNRTPSTSVLTAPWHTQRRACSPRILGQAQTKTPNREGLGVEFWWPGAGSKNRPQPVPTLAFLISPVLWVHRWVHQTNQEELWNRTTSLDVIVSRFRRSVYPEEGHPSGGHAGPPERAAANPGKRPGGRPRPPEAVAWSSPMRYHRCISV